MGKIFTLTNTLQYYIHILKYIVLSSVLNHSLYSSAYFDSALDRVYVNMLLFVFCFHNRRKSVWVT